MIDCCATTTSTQDLAQVLAFGFLMSAGHCLGMCGPLVCAVSSAASRERGGRTPWSALLWHHAGRITSYALLGIALGSIGGAVLDLSATRWSQALLAFLAAAALVWTGLGLLGVFPLASCAWAGRIVRVVAGGTAGTRSRANAGRRFVLGMANGLLPCGPVYTVAIAALAAGGALRGAVAMAVFGLGTVPLLVALSLGIGFVGAKLRVSLHRVAAAWAIAMGLQLCLRGLAGLDWVPHARLGEVVLW